MRPRGVRNETDPLRRRHHRLLAGVVRGRHRHWLGHGVPISSDRRQSDGGDWHGLAKFARHGAGIARGCAFLSGLDKRAEGVRVDGLIANAMNVPLEELLSEKTEGAK